VSWPWLVVLVLAAALVAAVERPRLERALGRSARKERDRRRRKARLRVVVEPEDDSDEFVRSVQRDLDSLPTIEERDRRT
jgi:flagellar biosynthesis/type III secretory pathway M-ring protein FliF/YscJ